MGLSLVLGSRHLSRKLGHVPYVICTHCQMTNYAPRSYQAQGTRCPNCEETLGEPASGQAVNPAPDHASQRVIRAAEDSAPSAADRPAAA